MRPKHLAKLLQSAPKQSALVSLIISRVHGNFNIQFIMVLAITVSTSHATHVRMRVWAVGAGAGVRIRMHARMRVFVRCGAARSVTELLWELSTVWGETQRCAAVTPRGRVGGRGQH